MYTQCPECEVAFRITAEVLQQARGQVRCGSCGSAFNALDHLHEEPPAIGGTAGDGTGADDALLDTLDRMAGSEEVRIEDTGVEWLVLEDAKADDEPVDGSWNVKEGERGADSVETDLDTAETSEQPALDEQAALYFGGVPEDEIRYDDNTPLPDDFGEEQGPMPPPVPARRSTDNVEPPSEAEEAQSLLELSEPDEWEGLLEEVDPTRTETAGDEPGDLPLEIEEELVAIHEELATLPESLPDTDPASDTDPGAAAEPAASDDESNDESDDKSDEESDAAKDDSEAAETAASAEPKAPDTEPVDAEAAPPAVEDDASGNAAPSDAELSLDDVAQLEDADESFTTTEVPVDVDQSELLDADDLELLAEDEREAETDPESKTEAESEVAPAADVETPADADAEQDVGVEAEAEPVAPAGDEPQADAETVTSESTDAAAEAESRETDSVPDDEPASDDAESSGEFERAIKSAENEIIAEREQENGDAQGDEEAQPVSDIDSDIASVTANMQIDDELLRAMQDQELAASLAGEDGEPVVETIVMEGDVVRGMLDEAAEEKESAQQSSRESLGDPASLIDTYMMSRTEERQPFSLGAKTTAVLVAVLALGLAAQYVHSSREYLATFAFFNQTIGPVYRMFGSPVTPAWDIKGWQFEATSGSTDVDNAVLTISSRIANRSAQALPYPLVHVSLTDRYEEIIGSRVLEPNEYLTDDSDASQPVAAGANFTATITIASPAADATGFKLNVCYRDGPGRVRCAIEDFKAP